VFPAPGASPAAGSDQTAHLKCLREHRNRRMVDPSSQAFATWNTIAFSASKAAHSCLRGTDVWRVATSPSSSRHHPGTACAHVAAPAHHRAPVIPLTCFKPADSVSGLGISRQDANPQRSICKREGQRALFHHPLRSKFKTDFRIDFLKICCTAC
jgi:hypothetical protein